MRELAQTTVPKTDDIQNDAVSELLKDKPHKASPSPTCASVTLVRAAAPEVGTYRSRGEELQRLQVVRPKQRNLSSQRSGSATDVRLLHVQ